MKTVRLGVFETNSSSCHSVAIYNKKPFYKFMNEGYLLINSGIELNSDYDDQKAAIISDEQIISIEDFVEMYREEATNVLMNLNKYSPGDRENLKFITEHWNVDFLSWVFDIKKYDSYEKFCKMEDDGILVEPTEYRYTIEEHFSIDARSFNSLYWDGLCDEEIKTFKSENGDEIIIVDTEISC